MLTSANIGWLFLIFLIFCYMSVGYVTRYYSTYWQHNIIFNFRVNKEVGVVTLLFPKIAGRVDSTKINLSKTSFIKIVNICCKVKSDDALVGSNV